MANQLFYDNQGQCLDDDQVGHGRRKRDITANSTKEVKEGETESFLRDFELKVVMPEFKTGTLLDQLLSMYIVLAITHVIANKLSQSLTPAMALSAESESMTNEQLFAGNELEPNCQSVAIASGCLSILFVLCTTVATLLAVRARQKAEHLAKNPVSYWDRQ